MPYHGMSARVFNRNIKNYKNFLGILTTEWEPRAIAQTNAATNPPEHWCTDIDHE